MGLSGSGKDTTAKEICQGKQRISKVAMLKNQSACVRSVLNLEIVSNYGDMPPGSHFSPAPSSTQLWTTLKTLKLFSFFTHKLLPTCCSLPLGSDRQDHTSRFALTETSFQSQCAIFIYKIPIIYTWVT